MIPVHFRLTSVPFPLSALTLCPNAIENVCGCISSCGTKKCKHKSGGSDRFVGQTNILVKMSDIPSKESCVSHKHRADSWFATQLHKIKKGEKYIIMRTTSAQEKPVGTTSLQAGKRNCLLCLTFHQCNLVLQGELLEAGQSFEECAMGVHSVFHEGHDALNELLLSAVHIDSGLCVNLAVLFHVQWFHGSKHLFQNLSFFLKFVTFNWKKKHQWKFRVVSLLQCTTLPAPRKEICVCFVSNLEAQNFHSQTAGHKIQGPVFDLWVRDRERHFREQMGRIPTAKDRRKQW